ncbi:MAG: hypothetical protein V7603_648 [Micromonosporaceae bacterium]
MRVNEDNEDWVVIGHGPGARQLAVPTSSPRATPRRHWISPVSRSS